MLRLAGTEESILTPAAFFDADQFVLNCENGLLDLHTGALYAHDPMAYCAKLAGAAYDPAATCPTWNAFITRITDGDAALAGFLQRAAGYTLTGATGEQCLFFAHGSGANGKSTFFGALTAILGDYAAKMPADALMSKERHAGSGPSPELARLNGARLVLASELDEGRRLSESLVKDLTGGDVITARHLHKEYFDFKPTFKLWLYGNHRPVITGTDEAIWRRVRLIPFLVTIPEPERDADLPEKLLEEAPGILAWAVRGCLDWQRGGLGLSQAVQQATAAYRADMDIVGRFLEEQCTFGVNLWCSYADLRAAYEAWATANGEPVLLGRRFGNYLAERGFKPEYGAGHAAIRRGLGLAV
jgi:putative DNA primase/helicase